MGSGITRLTSASSTPRGLIGRSNQITAVHHSNGPENSHHSLVNELSPRYYCSDPLPAGPCNRSNLTSPRTTADGNNKDNVDDGSVSTLKTVSTTASKYLFSPLTVAPQNNNDNHHKHFHLSPIQSPNNNNSHENSLSLSSSNAIPQPNPSPKKGEKNYWLDTNKTTQFKRSSWMEIEISSVLGSFYYFSNVCCC
jgi:hypothetical protein